MGRDEILSSTYRVAPPGYLDPYSVVMLSKALPTES
jgi:hypothetical protein